MRLGYLYTWDSRWFMKKNYTKSLLEDTKIRKYIKDRFYRAAISKIIIERFGQKIRVGIYTARPGIIIGRGGEAIENLREELQKLVSGQIQIDIHEINQPELDAQLLAETIAVRIERRVAFRRAMKQAIFLAMRSGALGIKVACSGRLAGAEIARCEWYKEGRIPLQTFRADIDYGFAVAMTKYGKIGVKVWIFKGEKFVKEEIPEEIKEERGVSDVDAKAS
jgi:small subunit ribosomal protein S3